MDGRVTARLLKNGNIEYHAWQGLGGVIDAARLAEWRESLDPHLGLLAMAIDEALEREEVRNG